MSIHQTGRRVAVSTVLLMMFCGSAISQQEPVLPEGEAQPEQQQQPRNVLNDHLYPPEFILQNAAKIRLLNSQRDAIEKEMSTFQQQLPQQQEKYNAEMETLGTQLDDASADPSGILTQLDNVLRAEFTIKRMQLHMLVRVRSQLTPAQRESMSEIKAQAIADQQQLQQRLQAKIIRVQQLSQQRAAQGNPPTQALQLLQTFQQQYQSGNVQQAEAILDQALQMLQGGQ